MVFLLIIAVQIFLLSSLKFTAWPEMLVWPYLITKGWLPYADIAIAHTPMLPVALALVYKLAGTGIIQLKFFTWGLIILSDILLYVVANKIWDKKTALFSVLSFAIWQIFFDGNGLWFEIVIVPLAISLFYFLHKKNYLIAGVVWGFMFFTKQTSVWFLMPVICEICVNGNKKHNILKNIKKFTFGGLIVALIYVLVIYFYGIFPAFLSWAVRFGVFVLPRSSGQIQLPGIKNILVSAFPFLIFIPLIFAKKNKNLNLLIWAVAGVMGAYPRFEYFHLQPAIPFLAIGSGLVYASFYKIARYERYFIYIYLMGALYLLAGFFMRNYGEGVRFYDQSVVSVQKYVQDNTKPGDEIFVMNWWDSVYALTDTIPATRPLVPQLSWYQELSGIQDKEVADLKTSKPRLILMQSYSETGLSSYIPQKIYDFVLANYKVKDKVDGIEIYVPKQ